MRQIHPPHTHLLDLSPDTWDSRAQTQQPRDSQDAPALSADQIMTAGTVLLIVVALVAMWLTGWFA